MAEIVWTDGSGDGSFDDSANWSTLSEPGAGDEAVILLPGTITAGGGEEIDTLVLGAGATLIARDFTILGSPDADNATGTTTVAGTLVVADGGSLGIAGTLDNTGMVQLASGGDATNLVVGNGTVSTLTLTGGGTVVMADSNGGTSYFIGNDQPAVLDNLDNTIEGSGQSAATVCPS